MDWKSTELFLSADMISTTWSEPASSGAPISKSNRLRQLKEQKSRRASSALHALALACHAQRLSGRSLRRLPVLSHARYIGMTSGSASDVEVWLKAMSKCVEDEGKQMELVEKGIAEL